MCRLVHSDGRGRATKPATGLRSSSVVARLCPTKILQRGSLVYYPDHPSLSRNIGRKFDGVPMRVARDIVVGLVSRKQTMRKDARDYNVHAR